MVLSRRSRPHNKAIRLNKRKGWQSGKRVEASLAMLSLVKSGGKRKKNNPLFHFFSFGRSQNYTLNVPCTFSAFQKARVSDRRVGGKTDRERLLMDE